jgi:hypothetical protein
MVIFSISHAWNFHQGNTRHNLDQIEILAVVTVYSKYAFTYVLQMMDVRSG